MLPPSLFAFDKVQVEADVGADVSADDCETAADDGVSADDGTVRLAVEAERRFWRRRVDALD